MASLRDAMAYTCQNYAGSDLSKAKLAKILYLADWKSSLSRGQQITDVRWKFNHYGPYVRDVIEVAEGDELFEIRSDVTPFGNRRDVIRFTGSKPAPLNELERDIIDEIISKVRPLTFERFLQLVYSTYPIVVSDRGSYLDLPALARSYKAGVAVEA